MRSKKTTTESASAARKGPGTLASRAASARGTLDGILDTPVSIAVAGATGIVGSRLVERARERGHEVLELCRAHGVDLTVQTPDLAGVDVLVDATCSGTYDEPSMVRFHEAVSRRLGAAARAAGVVRTVVVSQVGAGCTDPSDGPTHAYMTAKLAQECAAMAHAPGVLIVRGAPSHEVAGRMLEWFRTGSRVPVPDLTLQPIERDALVDCTLDLATGPERAHGTVVEVAGPAVEQLAAMVSRIDETVVVEPVAGRTVLLPGPDAVLTGRTFDEWVIRPARPARA